jgi:hypothetical protein
MIVERQNVTGETSFPLWVIKALVFGEPGWWHTAQLPEPLKRVEVCVGSI